MQVHYVEAQKQSFPFATAKVAGPFETRSEMWDAVERLRPLYPDCVVRCCTENVSLKKGAALLGGPQIEERTNA